MGFVSNQWLNRGKGVRNRSYQPVPVSVSCDRASDGWSRTNEVVIEFTAQRSNGEYQTLHLSASETDEIWVALADCASQGARERVLASLLRDLSDAELLKALSHDLTRRTASD